jgi:hypothetical protein
VRKKPIIVFLTGGLGNQLFQMANALSLDPEREVHLEWALGKPRCNENARPDISSFQLPKRVHLMQNSNYSWLASKTAGYILRSGISPKRWEAIGVVRSISKILAAVVLSVHFRKRVRVESGTGIGFSTVSIKRSSSLVIGYFQSYKSAQKENVSTDLKSMKLVQENLKIREFRELAKVESPIIVHFRFGDYKKEKSFGIPNSNYYQKTIDQLVKKFPTSKIWVFSDEMEVAEKAYPREFASKTRWITDKELSSAETLEVMRLGNSYVIANSTFSWWAAILSVTENPTVFCPEPWFQIENEPIDLIPLDWNRVTAWQ